jgi:hypothetical protein
MSDRILGSVFGSVVIVMTVTTVLMIVYRLPPFDLATRTRVRETRCARCGTPHRAMSDAEQYCRLCGDLLVETTCRDSST